MDIRKYLKRKREDNGGGDAVTNTSTACLDRSSHSDQTQDSDQTNESGGPSGSGYYSDFCKYTICKLLLSKQSSVCYKFIVILCILLSL